MNIWGLMRGSKKPQEEADESSSPQFDALPLSKYIELCKIPYHKTTETKIKM